MQENRKTSLSPNRFLVIVAEFMHVHLCVKLFQVNIHKYALLHNGGGKQFQLCKNSSHPNYSEVHTKITETANGSICAYLLTNRQVLLNISCSKILAPIFYLGHCSYSQNKVCKLYIVYIYIYPCIYCQAVTISSFVL